ncbi:MAG: Asp-tRNA(Asn)/Glu-tRNA(Gln) amidotransferase subunit GatA [Candidatus Daviesbacteria bacterium]|nr:Asp-tRNA(Asn)/Glu-tRNA(Gln) amidotransferase subunit GatA [Candidatus Daviesbacteria bacterium]
MNNNITKLTLIETLKALEEKQFSEKELNEAYLERIKKLNPSLNAFLMVNKDTKGIPSAIKDSLCTKDIKTTAASKILENFIPPYNATVVDKLLEKEIGIIGKTNCDEFTMGSSGENSAFGPTKNPWDLTKVPGGSSSGSAVAVSADLCTFAIGTDTGCSVRTPASLCGVVGLKPSYGRVSRYGAIAMASSFDQIGPITKTVADARLVLEWISGPDGFDSNCVEIASSKTPRNDTSISLSTGVIAIRQLAEKQSLKGLKVGVPKEYFGEGLDKGVEKVIRGAISKLKDLGAEIIEISLPYMKYGIAAYYILVPCEISSNFARYDAIRYGSARAEFGPEIKRRIMLGTFALSAGYYDDYYAKAAKVRTLIKQDFENAFNPPAGGVDVIVGPVSPTVAWNLGEKVNDPLSMYKADIYTCPVNLAGLPGLSVPCGFSEGLPVGLQIIGKYMDEETILDVGEIYEQNTNWKEQKPELSF